MTLFLLSVVREKQVPPFVPMQRLKGQECLVTVKAPELPCALEAALVLRAGGFHCAGPERLVKRFAVLVVHSIFVTIKVDDLAVECFALLGGQCIKTGAYFMKAVDHIYRAVFSAFQP